MTTERNELTESQLDALLDQARSETAPVSDDLMARIMADAEREMPRVPEPVTDAKPSRGFFRELFAQIGGLPGVGGLAMAGIMGITIGIGDFGLQDVATQAFGLEILDYDISDLYADYSLGDS